MSLEVARYDPIQIKDMAAAVVKSGMFPAIKNESQAMTLFLLADANGMHPMKAALMFDVLPTGKPSMKGEAMLAEFQARGGTVKWLRMDDKECRGFFKSPGCPEGFEVSFTIEDAQRAQLTGKDNWRKYAADMLRWRCVTRGVKATLPAAGLGLYPTEVAQDFDEKPRTVKADAEIVEATTPVVTEADAGWSCRHCGAEIKQYASKSAQNPGRLYWLCEGARFEMEEAIKNGATSAKAWAQVKDHFGAKSRQWAEPWPREETSGAETGARQSGNSPTPAPPSDVPIMEQLEAEKERIAQKIAAES